jgi:hypothetical protein
VPHVHPVRGGQGAETPAEGGDGGGGSQVQFPGDKNFSLCKNEALKKLAIMAKYFSQLPHTFVM